jgi:hypothetical protein
LKHLVFLSFISFTAVLDFSWWHHGKWHDEFHNCFHCVLLAPIVVVHIAKYISSLWHAWHQHFNQLFKTLNMLWKVPIFCHYVASKCHQDHVQRKLCIKTFVNNGYFLRCVNIVHLFPKKCFLVACDKLSLVNVINENNGHCILLGKMIIFYSTHT